MREAELCCRETVCRVRACCGAALQSDDAQHCCPFLLWGAFAVSGTVGRTASCRDNNIISRSRKKGSGWRAREWVVRKPMTLPFLDSGVRLAKSHGQETGNDEDGAFWQLMPSDVGACAG